MACRGQWTALLQVGFTCSVLKSILHNVAAGILLAQLDCCVCCMFPCAGTLASTRTLRRTLVVTSGMTYALKA